MTAPKNAPRIREGISAYLLRNGWFLEGGGFLWNHDSIWLRSINGLPQFKAEALAKQRAMDRRAT